MGQEATCVATVKGTRVTGKARLETEALEFRATNVRVTIPFKKMKKVAARDGVLSMMSPDGPLTFQLGAAAAKWADKIQHPPSRFDKLGIKKESRVSTFGVVDANFVKELKLAVRSLSAGRIAKASDLVFYSVTHESELNRLAALKKSITPAGAIWVIRPKGRPEISERAVMAAGKAAGLVDVKVVSFSPTHTAEKFVIPVLARAAQ